MKEDLMFKKVPLRAIRLDGSTKPHAEMDGAVIAEYSYAIRQGATFPPMVVYFDGADFWLADGFHRFHAYRAAGVDAVSVEIRAGSKRDAALFSVGASAAHGSRRTSADKGRAVETLLADAEWAAWSNHDVAKACGVSTTFVDTLRSSPQTVCSDKLAERTCPTKHGTGDNEDGQDLRRVEPFGRGRETVAR
jgi:hypothetical protein